MHFILMILLSGLLIVPAFAGIYLLLMPMELIGAQYMNYRHRRSSFSPLKDEHFGNMRRKVIVLKFGGFFMVGFSVCLGYAVMTHILPL